MDWFMVRPPLLARKILPEAVWSLSSEIKPPSVYLTFDDGPDPSVTPFVLDCLRKHNAKATFFLLGKNAEQQPDMVRRILDEGHAIGNHGHSHLNGWTHSCSSYMADVQAAEKSISSKMYRPPYGRITWPQYRQLSKTFKVVMWDVMSYDFHSRHDADRCVKNVLTNTRPGSIIVFHDNPKAFKNLLTALPRCLEEFEKKGWQCRALELEPFKD
jgi:peptidoglycan/xylan/chitin deacetylase (PgdA/CDA1 family)